MTPRRLDAGAALALLAADPGSTCLCTDFDGTLAPIVDEPSASRPLPGATSALDRLARKLRTVAVVSGRRAAYIANALEVDPASRLEIYGIYGAEHYVAGTTVVDPAVGRSRPAIARLAASLREQLGEEAVEEKQFAVTVHWRRRPGDAARLRGVAIAASRDAGLEHHDGRMSVEIVVPGAPDKGTTVARLAAGASTACFLGDDTGDLPAFAALGALERRDGIRALRVAAASSESPGSLVDGADLVLDGPPAVISFLESLASMV